ncbi:MAG TPA: ABC transporter ATP-binding protein [Porphyromonadaceae bacterium]|nr:ABC transporter ATP-binding protein [Porphyromonadaceae bacterium]
MIEIKDVHKSFEGHEVLKGVSAKFLPGKNNLIIGQSGSGKTVLLKCIVGLFTPEQGEILYENENFLTMSKQEVQRLRTEMGMVFQGAALFDSMSVLENILLPLNMFDNQSPKEKLKRALFCLDRVNLKNATDLYPSEISGGMKKRVAIARAIALNPKYLFCDEPNSGLDPKTSLVIDELISDITQEYNITTIINTHDMNSVLGIGDNIIFINKGNLAWQGNKKEVIGSQNEELENFIFASDFLKNARDNQSAH